MSSYMSHVIVYVTCLRICHMTLDMYHEEYDDMSVESLSLKRSIARIHTGGHDGAKIQNQPLYLYSICIALYSQINVL